MQTDQPRNSPEVRPALPQSSPFRPNVWDSSRLCYILSLDGGGIKGLFSAAVLAHVEQDLKCKITDHFDLITGTSTGAIIAVALGMGHSPREIVNFYIKHGASIFPTSKCARALAAVRHVFRRKLDGRPLEHALRECLGERLLGESRSRLVIPSYDMGHDDVCLLKTPHHERFARDHCFKAWAVVMASAAAPSYFPAARGIEGRRLIDGGIWANNPVMVAITEAHAVLGAPLQNIRVVSLGTTDALCRPPDKLDNGGLLAWSIQGIRTALRGQSLGAVNQARLLLGRQNVFRLDPVVPDEYFALDKLDIEKHMALAAHESRHAMPELRSFIGNHRAAPYQPLYGPLSRTLAEAKEYA